MTVGSSEPEVEALIADLRKLREAAGQPSLRKMAKNAHYSHTTLAGVLSGGRLPSQELTLAFVRACGGDEDVWRARWHETNASINPPSAPEPPPQPPRWRRPAIVSGIAVAVIGFAAIMLSPYTTSSGSNHSPLLSPSPLSVTTPTHGPEDHPLIPGDDSKFVADITIPDGTAVHAAQQFTKIWEIRNDGTILWRGRYLERQGVLQGQGICTSVQRVPVPDTPPGHDVQITVVFTAPNLPGSCRVDWKMTDGNGHNYFPDRSGVYVIVNVIR